MKLYSFIIAIFLTIGLFAGCSSLDKGKDTEVQQHSSLSTLPVQPDVVAKVPASESLKPVSTQKDTPLPKIPVIMMHYIREVNTKKDPLGYNLSLEPAEFEKILKYLQENGYHTIHFNDVLTGKIPEKPIMLTFDDGYEDFYTTALPLLQKYGFTASEAIITEKMDGVDYMSPDQVKTIFNDGIEIFSHSKTHADMAKTAHADKEIEESKNYLESLLGVSITTFVYPSGKYNEDTMALVQKAGYKAAFTTNPGFTDFNGSLFELKRVRIDNRDGLPGLEKKLKRG